MINPKPEDTLNALYIDFATFDYQCFTMAHAKAIEGNEVRVSIQADGLQRTEKGIITAVNETLTLIGNEEIYNECIRQIRLTAFH